MRWLPVRSRILPLVLYLGLSLGCSEILGSKSPDTKTKKVPVVSTTKPPKKGLPKGSKTVPKDFPLPVMKGADVHRSWALKPEGKVAGHSVSLFTKASVDDAAAFYEGALKTQGLTVHRTDTKMGKAKMSMILGKKDAFNHATITISPHVWNKRAKGAEGTGAGIMLVWRDKL